MEIMLLMLDNIMATIIYDFIKDLLLTFENFFGKIHHPIAFYIFLLFLIWLFFQLKHTWAFTAQAETCHTLQQILRDNLKPFEERYEVVIPISP